MAATSETWTFVDGDWHETKGYSAMLRLPCG